MHIKSGVSKKRWAELKIKKLRVRWFHLSTSLRGKGMQYTKKAKSEQEHASM